MVVGIDPGLRGGVAVGSVDALEPEVFALVPIETSADGEKIGSRKQVYRSIDPWRLAKDLVLYLKDRRSVAFIEGGLSFAKNGIRSAERTGRIIGRIEGVLSVFTEEVIVVRATDWRHFHDLPRGRSQEENKPVSVELALRRFPGLRDRIILMPPPRKDGSPSSRPAKVMDGLAEAALIWAYGCSVLRQGRSPP